MRKTCEQCGRGFDAERSDARFCGSTCRGRSWREDPGPGPAGDGSAESSPAPAPVTVAPASVDEPTRPRYRLRRRLIADEVEDRLRAAGMLDSWQGAAALDLADSLDWQGGSGSARAAIHRELRAIMGDLLRGSAEAGSSVGRMRDELADRRARRVGGA